MVLLSRDGASSGRVCQCAQSDAVCANVRNRTTGAPQPIVLLPHGASLHVPHVACSVTPGRCIFIVAGFARLRRRTVAPVCASVRKRMTGASCGPWSLVLLPYGVPL